MIVFHDIRQLEEVSKDSHLNGGWILEAGKRLNFFPLFVLHEVEEVFGAAVASKLPKNAVFYAKRNNRQNSIGAYFENFLGTRKAS